MGREHVVAQPDARIGERQARRCHRPRDRRGQRRGLRRRTAAPGRAGRARRRARAPRARARRGRGRGCRGRAGPGVAPSAAPIAARTGSAAASASRAGPWRSSIASPSRTRRSTPSSRARSRSAPGPAQDVGSRARPRCRSEITSVRIGPEVAWGRCRVPWRAPRRRLLARARGAAGDDDPRRPRRRRRQGRAPGRGRRHARLGPAVRRGGLDVLPRASTATSARWRSTSGDPGDGALAANSRRAPTSWSRASGRGRWRRSGSATTTSRRRNPGVVYCSVSAFGTGEAAARLPGYDLLLQAMGGLMSVTGEADGPPLKAGAALIDMVCGLYATIGILAALRARGRRRGQRVEVSLMDSALAALLNQARRFLMAGVVPGPAGQPPSVDRAVRDVPGRRRRLRAGRRQRREVRPAVRRAAAPGPGPTRASRRTPRAWPAATRWRAGARA